MDDLPDHLQKLPLQLVLWRLSRLLLCHSNRLDWFRQCPLIDLLVLVQGDALYLHRRGGYHVRRFPLQDEIVQRLDVYLLVADDIGSDELASAFFIEGLHGHVPDAGELLDDTLYLAHLDAEAADLHLTVATADELQIAVRQPAHDVACMVDAVVGWFLTEGVRRKGLCVLLGTVQVAAGHLRTADPQLALLSVLHRPSFLVHHVEAERVERLADGCILLKLPDRVGRREDSALRRTIDIIQLEVLRRLYGDEAFATYGEVLQRVIVYFSKLTPHLCGHEGVGDMVGLEVVVQGDQVQTDLLGNDMHRGTRSQGGIHIHHTGVEAVAGIGCHAVAGLQVIVTAIPVAERHQIPVLQHTPLGNPR